MLPTEMLDVLVNEYWLTQALKAEVVKLSTGFARFVRVCVKVGPGHPGTRMVWQVYTPGAETLLPLLLLLVTPEPFHVYGPKPDGPQILIGTFGRVVSAMDVAKLVHKPSIQP